jgi:hypothetical protein
MSAVSSPARMIHRCAWFSVCVAIAFASSPVGATVLQGPIDHLPEAVVVFTWGDGPHDLAQEWSLANPYFGGWFYGSTYTTMSNADVYTFTGLSDPTTVTNADSFPYSDSAVIGREGDCVFFRGTNGYYGAWRIDAIDPTGGNTPPYADLSGRWYFQDNGTGNFSEASPVQATTWGTIKALLK